MVKVSVEVRRGAARFNVAVRAENIQRALSLVRGRFPRDGVLVKFPIELESIFVEDPSAPAGTVGFERPEEVAT